MTRPVLPPRARTAVPALTTALILSACTGAPVAPDADTPDGGGTFPVTVTNCDREVTVEAAPERVITLNQGATEVVLALGLEDQLVGTAYLDDAVSPAWAAAYEEVPVLAKEYPTNEQVLAAEPDFVYASYASAFEAKVAGERDVLANSGVGTYLSPFGCPEAGQRPEATFEAAWQALRDVASLLGAPESATHLVAAQEESLSAIEDAAPGAGFDVVWFDSGDKTPFVGGGDGGPQLILDALGATNVFEDLEGGWGDGNWEDVLAADPDVIVLADAAWSTAKEKRAYLEKDPVLRDLEAVQAGAFITVPFSATTPGVRLVDGASTVADAIDALDPLP